jgi:hypothetical protein
MRWKLSKDPEVGDVRYNNRFAWLPLVATNIDEDDQEYLIWLSFYKRKQVYSKYFGYNACGGGMTLGWLTKERIIINHIPKKW